MRSVPLPPSGILAMLSPAFMVGAQAVEDGGHGRRPGAEPRQRLLVYCTSTSTRRRRRDRTSTLMT